ncbi:MAG: protoporphyrinogen oxidase HemJ [Rhodomicrobium sp.]
MSSFLYVSAETFQLLIAFHLIAAFAWMAGMFYLPRLYAYHAEAGARTPQAATFKVMERRLLKVIMNPAMIVTIALGLWIAFGSGRVDWSTAGWLHVKIVLVLLLAALHGFLAKWRKDFEVDNIPHSPRFFRVINEVPTVLLIGIVILAVVKPF